MECPQCQHHNPPGAKFCVECGSPIVCRCLACSAATPPAAKTLAPALCEWRAELVGMLGDHAKCLQLLREAHRGYEEIGAPGHAARLRQELGS